MDADPTPDRSAPEGLVEALAGAVRQQLRGEADMSSRPGQFNRLNAIADALVRDLRAALRPSDAAGADLRASDALPRVDGPTEASAGAREAGEG